jgi:hypothetical protein
MMLRDCREMIVNVDKTIYICSRCGEVVVRAERAGSQELSSLNQNRVTIEVQLLDSSFLYAELHVNSDQPTLPCLPTACAAIR